LKSRTVTWLMGLAVAFMVVLIPAGSPPLAQSQFFGGDPLQDASSAVLAATFMQHAEHSGASYDTLHSGIDVWGYQLPENQLYSANQGRAQIIGLGSEYILLVRCDISSTEIVQYAHVTPKSGYTGGEMLNTNTAIATLPTGEHTHIQLYKSFAWDKVWDLTPYQPPYYDIWLVKPNIDLTELKCNLVHPATNAFEEAETQNSMWLNDTVPPTISECRVERVSGWGTNGAYVVIIRAHDMNDNLVGSSDSNCKPGIYKIEWSVDGTVQTPVIFEEWPAATVPCVASAGDFYVNGDLPPSGCNEEDSLNYYLVWEHFDCADHDFRVKVYDVAGNMTPKLVKYKAAIDPPLTRPFSLAMNGRNVCLRWSVLDDNWFAGFDVARSFLEEEVGTRANATRIPARDSQGFPILDHEFWDLMPTDPRWEAIFYTLQAVTEDGRIMDLARATIRNPLWATDRIMVSPNPFEGYISIEFMNPREADRWIRVYDARGRLVNEIENANLPRGWTACEWNGRDHQGNEVSPGVYFVVVSGQNRNLVAKVTLVR